MDTATFGRRLTALRQAAGLTPAEFARRAGISRPQLWRYERGEWSPPLRIFFRIADALGVSLDTFRKSDGEKIPAKRSKRG